MKRAGLNCGALLIIICVVLFGMPLVTHNQTTQAAAAFDALNPVVPKATVYVTTATDRVEWVPNAHGGRDYRYELISYDRLGTARRLLIQVTDRPLAANRFLAVRIKGQKVLSWKAISQNQVPRAVHHNLALQ